MCASACEPKRSRSISSHSKVAKKLSHPESADRLLRLHALRRTLRLWGAPLRECSKTTYRKCGVLSSLC